MIHIIIKYTGLSPYEPPIHSSNGDNVGQIGRRGKRREDSLNISGKFAVCIKYTFFFIRNRFVGNKILQGQKMKELKELSLKI